MKNKKKIPFVSIVIPAYNEEKTIELALSSLLKQFYPRSKYEIIVVDDGSKDNTTNIVSKYPVRLIKHKKNLGPAQARNTGLKYAKGEIYVGFDADCIAEKKWLNELMKIYLFKKDVIGVGGQIISPPLNNLTEKFIQEGGCGNPTPVYVIQSKSIFSRFYSYLKSKLVFNNKSNLRIFKVGNIMGSNSSFYRTDLKSIDGWDNNLSAGEDTDICYRLKKTFPDKDFYVNKNAKLLHNHNLSFFKYIRRPFSRGAEVVKLYRKQKKFPPIFPFPLITIFFSILLGFFNIWFLPLSLILLPQILYFWYPIKFIKKFDKDYLIFPYMQVLLEFSAILGLARGYFILKFRNNHAPHN